MRGNNTLFVSRDFLLFITYFFYMMANDCRRNIEIKAELSDKNEFDRMVKVAENICDKTSKSEVLKQRDVFFNVEFGRLKLRYEVCLIIILKVKKVINNLIAYLKNDDKVMLVQYSRADIAGPKLSNFHVLNLDVNSGQLLETMLKKSNGVLGVLSKTRYLFMYEKRTRIHLDIVRDELKNCDYFGMEFEVLLEASEETSTGEDVAQVLLKKFNISEEMLRKQSYFEILQNK